MPRKPQPGPSLFDAAPAQPPVDFVASKPQAPLVAPATEAEAPLVFLSPPQPDHTSRHERELASKFAQGANKDIDQRHVERIVAWRSWQGMGETEPTWGSWGEWLVGDVVVLYRPESHYVGADSLEFFHEQFKYGRYSIGLRKDREGKSLAQVIQERLAHVMPNKEE